MTIEYKIKFNLNTFMEQLNQKKKYVQQLKKKIKTIELIKKNKYQALYKLIFPKRPIAKYKKNYYPLFISFILSVIYSKTNTFVHVMDFAGNMKLFYSAGDAGYWGKEKVQRGLVVRSIFKIFFNQLSSLLTNSPIAVHLVHIRHQISIIRYLKKKFFIRSVSFFNRIPHNGCRQPKIRRIKIRTRKFK